MAKILGLDLGTNSIGWAIINNEPPKILGAGVRIFTEGVENLGQGEKEQSKNSSRTGSRSERRNYFRRKLRKKALLKVLDAHRMCPFENESFTDWFKLNPYELRAKALSARLSLLELGRIFYHIAQRRGFQSNSRSEAANENTKIYKPKDGKAGINETQELIQNCPSGTLGGALCDLPKSFKPWQKRLRNRYTTRQMHVEEFEKIWAEQSKYHPNLTPELKATIGGRKRDGYDKDGILFFQRPLRSQKHRVGKCSFEPSKTKCPISAIQFELFRAHQFINSIECDGEKLSDEDRKVVLELLLRKEKVPFKDIRKKIQKFDAHYKFNFQDDDKITGCSTVSKLCNSKCFGEDWFEFSKKQQEDIWHVLYHFDDKEKLKKHAIEKWEFDEKRAIHVANKIFLKQGYANLSNKAINNILPFLEMGFTYDRAVAFGGIKNAFGILWNDLTEKELQFLFDNVPEIVGFGAKGGYIEQLKNTLKEHFNMSEHQFKKLYHHSANIHSAALLKKLPTGPQADREITNIRNPIVIQALFELRKLVNTLIDEFGKFDEIKIELARDLKISKTERQRIRSDNKKREEYHDKIAEILQNRNVKVNHENILKYKLWEECKRTCPYTGKEISFTQLYDNANTIEIEHIFPYSRSLDDSYLNKTLCFRDENAAKGNRTPFKYYSALGNWQEVKARALTIFHDTKEFPNRYKKFKRFVATKFNEDFISRQLNDTRYISKAAKNYLSKICNKIKVAPGQMTAKLRYHWGLNSVISSENEEKSREDHRHHAIDALVMACFSERHLNEISKWNRYRRSYDLKDFPPPWDNFRYEAIQAINKILVSHKKSSRVLSVKQNKIKKDGRIFTNKGIAARGELHKESVFGKRKAPKEEKPNFHIRKPLESLKNKKHIEKIVDDRVKKIIYDHLENEGVDIHSNSFKIPPGAFFEKDPENGKIKPKVFLPNKNGDPVPIFKVRLKEELGNAVQLKGDINQFVNPRNNHHVLIYKDLEGDLKESVVNFWTAVERKLKGEPVVSLPPDGVEIICALQINDMFLLGLKPESIKSENPDFGVLSQHLYRVQKLSSMYYTFRHHLASTLKYGEDEIRITSFKKWKSLNPVKVFISPSGEIKIH